MSFSGVYLHDDRAGLRFLPSEPLREFGIDWDIVGPHRCVSCDSLLWFGVASRRGALRVYGRRFAVPDLLPGEWPGAAYHTKAGGGYYSPI